MLLFGELLFPSKEFFVKDFDENFRLRRYPEGVFAPFYISEFKEIMSKHNVEYLKNIATDGMTHHVKDKIDSLTDEEFKLMKSHTTIGGEIIAHIISTVPDPDYLYEAKNLATYHHEKWNGKGYPEGLSGTDIPLSARVMAVADVFDALVSKRVYKPGMPMDKAFSIIREDSGTHFDPEVVEAFFAAEDDVRRVEEIFSKLSESEDEAIAARKAV